MPDLDITSPGNDQVKRLVRLRRRSHRDAEGLFVVEEERIIARAIEAGHRPVELFVCPDLHPGIDGLAGRTMSEEAMNRATYRKAATGLIALFPYFDRSLEALRIREDALLLVAEGLEKPGNLGAILRVCDGAGADGLVLVDATTDIFNPNAVRASTGALFTVPIGSGSIGEVADWLARAGVRSVAAHPAATLPHWDADLRGARALWIGSESRGLSAAARELAEETVTIPMAGDTDSLNASVAAAVLLYESIRQRARPNRS